MQILVMIAIVLIAVFFVTRSRQQQDRRLISARIAEAGGELLQLSRVKRGSPFPDTTRGWWAWRVQWHKDGESRQSWVLTTRAGIKEWRD